MELDRGGMGPDSEPPVPRAPTSGAGGAAAGAARAPTDGARGEHGDKHRTWQAATWKKKLLDDKQL